MAALFARESNRAITCEADEEKKTLAVSSISNEIGENRSEIDAVVEQSGKVKLDSRFLTDALNVLEEKNVKMEFSLGSTPVLLMNEKGKNYCHIIMPLNV